MFQSFKKGPDSRQSYSVSLPAIFQTISVDNQLNFVIYQLFYLFLDGDAILSSLWLLENGSVRAIWIRRNVNETFKMLRILCRLRFFTGLLWVLWPFVFGPWCAFPSWTLAHKLRRRSLFVTSTTVGYDLSKTPDWKGLLKSLLGHLWPTWLFIAVIINYYTNSK